MMGTHILSELRNIKGFIITKEGIVITRYGRVTVNYWIECRDGLWKNYTCRTLEYV